jgi:hypothetical protein
LGLFQSDLLKEFKSAVRRGITKPSYEMFDLNPTAVVTQDVKDKIAEDLKKYHDLGDQILKQFVQHQHHGLAECNATYVQMLKEQIEDESPKRKAYYMYVLDKICELYKTQSEFVAHLPRPSQGFGLGGQQAAQEVLPKLPGDTQHKPPSTQHNPGNGFGPLQRNITHQIQGMDAYTNHTGFKQSETGLVPDKIVPVIYKDPHPLSEGGKSRRRHRRVKFGKSKKGRTTRRIIRKHRR